MAQIYETNAMATMASNIRIDKTIINTHAFLTSVIQLVTAIENI